MLAYVVNSGKARVESSGKCGHSNASDTDVKYETDRDSYMRDERRNDSNNTTK